MADTTKVETKVEDSTDPIKVETKLKTNVETNVETKIKDEPDTSVTASTDTVKTEATDTAIETENTSTNEDESNKTPIKTESIPPPTIRKQQEYDQKKMHKEKMFAEFMKEPEVTIKREGLAKFYKTPNVFYNPAMSTNRDVSVAVIETYANMIKEEFNQKHNISDDTDEEAFPGVKILEGLSATGLRSARYYQEIDDSLIDYIQANDINETSCELIEENFKLNNIPSSKGCISCGDINMIMMQYKNVSNDNLFDVIDLDPYGTAAPFLENAMIAIKDGGLLCITCTDVASLCGNNIEACYRKYRSIPINDAIMHENALRIVLATTTNAALNQSCYIKPLLSLHIDYYVRIFVQVFKKPRMTKKAIVDLADCYYCYKCGTWDLRSLGIEKIEYGKYLAQPVNKISTCIGCDSLPRKTGPVWGSPIHDHEFVTGVHKFVQENRDFLPTSDRLGGILKNVLHELPDSPYYINQQQIVHKIKFDNMSNSIFRSAIVNAGYKYSFTHTTPNATKTNAPFNVIWDIFREWGKTKGPPNIEKMRSNGKVDEPRVKIIEAILNKTTTTEVNFTVCREVRHEPKGTFKNPPIKHWGPGRAAPTAKHQMPYDGDINIDRYNKNENENENADLLSKISIKREANMEQFDGNNPNQNMNTSISIRDDSFGNYGYNNNNNYQNDRNNNYNNNYNNNNNYRGFRGGNRHRGGRGGRGRGRGGRGRGGRGRGRGYSRGRGRGRGRGGGRGGGNMSPRPQNNNNNNGNDTGNNNDNNNANNNNNNREGRDNSPTRNNNNNNNNNNNGGRGGRGGRRGGNACIFWSTKGNCHFGEKCKFEHPPK